MAITPRLGPLATRWTSREAPTIRRRERHQPAGIQAHHPNGTRTGTIAASRAPATTYSYDVLGRVLSKTLPDGTGQTFRHTHLRTIEVDAIGRSREVYRTPDGRVRNVTYQGSESNYTYGAFGSLIRLSHGTTNAVAEGTKYTTNAYDALGRLIGSTDANLRRTYNAFGELVHEERGGIVTDSKYDALGRRTKVVSTNPDGIKDFASFTYDEGANGVGKLTSEASGQDGTRSLFSPFFVLKSFAYDKFGRLTNKTYDEILLSARFDYTYDKFGRPDIVQYPNLGSAADRFGVKYVYTAYGDLQAVRDARTDGTYWQVRSRTPDGLLGSEHFGNSVDRTWNYETQTRRLTDIDAKRGNTLVQQLHYDYWEDGNVRARTDNVAAIVDTYNYDQLNQLRRWNSSGARNVDRFYEYWPDGSPKHVDGEQFADGTTKARDYKYTNAAFPNAVSSDGDHKYEYDALGRQTKRTLLAGQVDREVSYTAFDLPRRITSRDGSGTTARTTDFAYDAENERVFSQTGVDTVQYADGIFERRSDFVESPSSIVNTFRIVADSRVVAEVTRRSDDSSQPLVVNYLHGDMLSSTTVVTDSAGAVVENLFYEPFGRRLGANGSLLGKNVAAHRPGFTGHEHDDEHGLINMRGRMYDPTLRSFLSRDPLVADPLNPLAYNPYSYVTNRPLLFTDPSGFQPVSDIDDSDLTIDVIGTRLPPPDESRVANVILYFPGSDDDHSLGGGLSQGPGDRFNPYDNQFQPWTSPFGEAHRGNGVDYTHPPDATPRGFANFFLDGLEGQANARTEGGEVFLSPTNAQFALAVVGMVTATKGLAKLGGRAAGAMTRSSGVTRFYHGTTALEGRAMLGNLKPVSTATHRFEAGSFFAHEATSPNALEAASSWPVVQGKVASTGVRVVEISVPNSVLTTLRTQGLIQVGPVPGMGAYFPMETVFSPAALETLNNSATFRLIEGRF